MRGALTQGDIASWIVAGEYTTRAPARHRYDLGLSYSTQRYDGGNFAALRDVTDGSRNAGALYAFDTFTISPALTLTYGGRYARYDYLEGGSLISPRVALTRRAGRSLPRQHDAVEPRAWRRAPKSSCRAIDSGIWLPPQRTFSSLAAGRPLEAERTNHVEVEVERDFASADGVAARVPAARRRSARDAVRRRHAGRAGGRSATTSSATSATSTPRV